MAREKTSIFRLLSSNRATRLAIFLLFISASGVACSKTVILPDAHNPCDSKTEKLERENKGLRQKLQFFYDQVEQQRRLIYTEGAGELAKQIFNLNTVVLSRHSKPEEAADGSSGLWQNRTCFFVQLPDGGKALATAAHDLDRMPDFVKVLPAEIDPDNGQCYFDLNPETVAIAKKSDFVIDKKSDLAFLRFESIEGRDLLNTKPELQTGLPLAKSQIGVGGKLYFYTGELADSKYILRQGETNLIEKLGNIRQLTGGVHRPGESGGSVVSIRVLLPEENGGKPNVIVEIQALVSQQIPGDLVGGSVIDLETIRRSLLKNLDAIKKSEWRHPDRVKEM
ncbi:MAG: hypothetical protein ABIH35_04540 [Patescibacteria group bacterium]